jgi:hypothetical protein
MTLSEKEIKLFPFRPSIRTPFFEKYPQLKNTPAFVNYKGTCSFDKIFCYVILIYTHGTPLMQIVDHNDRKRTAAEMSGFTLLTQKYRDAVMGLDPEVNAVIIAYLRMQKSFKWSKLCGFIDSFYHQLAKLQAGETDSEKTKDLLANITTTEREIEKVMTEFVNFDPSESLKDSIKQTVEDDRIMGLRPEAMAVALAEGSPEILAE